MWSLPFLIASQLSIIVTIILVVKFSPNTVQLIYFVYFLLINLFFLIFFFRKVIHYSTDQRKKLMDLLKEQDRSAKLLIRRDLDLMRANEKLMDLDNQKSEFISVIAHQMRTPLSAMKWTLSMLLKNELGQLTLDQNSFIQKANESNVHMISLVEDMLLADKLDTGRSELVKTEINVGDIIEEVLYELKSKVEPRHITIHHKGCDAQICKVVADKEKIRAVIQNLFENAVKYTKDNGNIYIQTYDSNHKLYISIKDSGIGIPKDQQAYIFKKFYRARNASRQEANGSGLGLFIAKSIIEKHNGEISFESEEGVGTTFTFYIPKN